MTRTPLSDDEFQTRKDELDEIARTIDLWSATPKTKEQKKLIKELNEKLHAALYLIECDFLETKLAYYTQIRDVIKQS